MMTTRVLCFAEWATMAEGQKLVIGGVIDGWLLPPGRKPGQGVTLGGFYLVAIVEGSLADGLQHVMGVRIVDGNGRQIALNEMGPVHFKLMPDGRPLRMQLLIGFGGLPLPGPGDYMFELLADGKRIGDAPFYVTEVTQPTG